MKFNKRYELYMEDAMMTHKEMDCPKCGSEETTTLRKRRKEGAGGYRKAKLHKCKKCHVIFDDNGKELPKH